MTLIHVPRKGQAIDDTLSEQSLTYNPLQKTPMNRPTMGLFAWRLVEHTYGTDRFSRSTSIDLDQREHSDV